MTATVIQTVSATKASTEALEDRNVNKDFTAIPYISFCTPLDLQLHAFQCKAGREIKINSRSINMVTNKIYKKSSFMPLTKYPHKQLFAGGLRGLHPNRKTSG